jgi:hypothetical protein
LTLFLQKRYSENTQEEAEKFFESVVQLKESERYEYKLEPLNGKNCYLRCKQSSRWQRLADSLKSVNSDVGLIETFSFCGKLLLEVVEMEETGNRRRPLQSKLMWCSQTEL